MVATLPQSTIHRSPLPLMPFIAYVFHDSVRMMDVVEGVEILQSKSVSSWSILAYITTEGLAMMHNFSFVNARNIFPFCGGVELIRPS